MSLSAESRARALCRVRGKRKRRKGSVLVDLAVPKNRERGDGASFQIGRLVIWVESGWTESRALVS